MLRHRPHARNTKSEKKATSTSRACLHHLAVLLDATGSIPDPPAINFRVFYCMGNVTTSLAILGFTASLCSKVAAAAAILYIISGGHLSAVEG